MKVLLIYKANHKPVFIDNAISVRIQRFDTPRCDSWAIETSDHEVQLFTCANWYVYLHYEQK